MFVQSVCVDPVWDAGWTCSSTSVHSCHVEGFVTFFVFALFAAGCVIVKAQPSGGYESRLGTVICIVIITGMSAMSTTSMVPVAYDIAIELGYGALHSGILIGVPSVASFFSWLMCTVLFFNSSYVLRCKLGLAFQSVGALTHVFCYAIPTLVNLGNGQQFWILVGLRFLAVFFHTVGIYFWSIIGVNLVTSSEMTYFQIGRTLSRNFGVIIGPVLVALSYRFRLTRACDGYSIDGFELATLQCVTLGIMFIFMAAFTAFVMPRTEDKVEIPSISEEMEEMGTKSDTDALLAVDGGRLRDDMCAKKTKIFYLSTVFCIERHFGMYGVESATALILEKQYGWDAEIIGSGLLLCGASAIVVAAATIVATHYEIVSQRFLILFLCVASLFGTVLLWDFSFIPAFGLIIGDCIYYSCQSTSTCLMTSIWLENTIPDTWYSRESYISIIYLVSAVVGLTTSPLVRFAIDTWGRNAYALAQIFMTVASVFTCAKIVRLSD